MELFGGNESIKEREYYATPRRESLQLQHPELANQLYRALAT
jgi:hypothetical protein